MTPGRLATAAAIAGLLATAAFPFIVLFPDPPAFGPESLLLATAFAIVATLAMAWRANRAGWRRILRRTGVLFGLTAATAVSSMVLHGGVPLLPTPDLLPALFSLDGEDAGTVVEGHRTAAFMAGAAHAAGTIANDDAHPLIRFTTGDGTPVTFRQNGGISRAVGAVVPVAYDPADPAGTAQADTLLAAWGEVMGLAWIGLGFSLFPFFGARAAFGHR